MNEMVRINFTDEQKSQLKPIFDLVKQSSGGVGICGQAFEGDGGYAQFRFLNHLQTNIVKAAILTALEVEKREELEALSKKIDADMAQLEIEKSRVSKKIEQIEARDKV